MNAELSAVDRELLRAPNYAWIVTLNPNGSPQTSITWVDTDDTHVLVNTAVGRRKDRNVLGNAHVAIAVQRGADAYRWISVEGVVDDRELGPEADEHIAALALAYDGEAWTPVEGQQRVRWRVRPVRIVRYGE
ncbi:MAG TPA: pyridoxamine 5'-phosphate oxidase family protein [Actinomycetota bacterium]|nr:pyridoxamine 5'-phosphate oxidase family protein [Actinomycetota bacterium]